MANRNSEKQKAYWRKWYHEHKEERKAQNKAYWQRFYSEHREMRLRKVKEGRQKVKLEVLTHYGGGNCACVKCGFADVRALTIDHIDGGGHQHLKEIKHHQGANFYYWLRKQDYPKGYQTLCANCQFIKRDELYQILPDKLE